MKYILFAAVLAFMAACTNTPEAAQKKEAVMVSDSVGIADALHGFFKWYEENNTRVDSLYNFIDDSGQHLTLNQAKLDAYLAEFSKSGFVSNAFVEDEKRFYATCSKFWATEPVDEVPTGLGADRYYCAQDFVAPYSTGKVTSTVKGDQADAVLSLDEATNFNFKMVKENGKWLLAKLGCNMGVEY
jgi:hypothetical protein